MSDRVMTGHSGAEVRRGDGRFRKVTPEAAREAATLMWLRNQGLPAAEVIDVGPDWLVTREIAGPTAAGPWPVHQRRRVVDAVADVTRTLHALPVLDCPFDRTLSVILPAARAAVARGDVDLDDLDDERRGWTGPQLLAALDAVAATMIERETPAVTHGDWCLPNVLLDPAGNEVIGIIDTARLGRADRHADLALMSRSLRWEAVNPQWGAEYADRFLQRCGIEPVDAAQLDFYRLLDEFF